MEAGTEWRQSDITCFISEELAVVYFSSLSIYPSMQVAGEPSPGPPTTSIVYFSINQPNY